MTEKQLDPRPFFVIGLVAVIGIGAWFILGVGGGQQNYPAFAACLADAGATMYGFDACPHCNKQKNLIGREAFRENFSSRGYYVECQPPSEAKERLGARANKISSVKPLQPSDTQGDACEINVGAGTPTWVIDGKKYVGEQSLARLANLTGCPLPEGYRKAEDVGGYTDAGGNGG